MSGVHKNPTISFRISDYERREIEARIKASGMMKKTFFTRCCIYDRICVVGKKETVYMLVQKLEKMQADIHKMYDEIIQTGQIKEKESPVRGVQLRKHSKAREKRYSFGYAVSFIFACYQILWTFPKSLYLCSRYLLLAYG